MNFRMTAHEWTRLIVGAVALCVLCTAPTSAHAQFSAGNHWYAGNNVHIDWSTPTSPVVTCDGPFATIEGVAATSDTTTGAPLLSTDGRTAYDGAGVAIPGATGLGGGGSSSQSAILATDPGDPNRVWLFAVRESGGPVTPHLFDLTGPTLVRSEASYPSSTHERATVIPHGNGTDIWLLYTSDAGGVGTVYSRLITATGVGPEQVAGTTPGATFGSIGYIVGSADNSMVAISAYTGGGFLVISDFDNSTGRLAGAPRIDPVSGTYGAAFSSDGAYLYATIFGSSELLQYDLATGAPPVRLTLPGPGQAGAITGAPDGHMYITRFNQPSITRLIDPLAPLTAANLTAGVLAAPGCTYTAGLPNFIASATVAPAVCGDGVVEGLEGCDDANTTAGDGCSAACEIESGWSCPTPGAACSEICGDGLVVGAESCDDGNTTPGDGCDATCTVETGWSCPPATSCMPVCGDGLTVGGEACDDAGESASCDADCTPAVCGDGTANATAGEPCDDGNTVSGDGCSADCGSTEVCGNGYLDVGESCDDGNLAALDGCSGTCTPESGWACSCSSPTFSYSMEVSAGLLGGSGGGPGPQMGCSGSDVLIGLAINWSNSRGEGVRTRAICGSFSVDTGGSVTTTRTTSQESGGAGCGGWDPSTWSPEVTCPSGWGIVGLRGLASNLSGTTTLFRDASIVCQQMGVDGNPAGPTMTLNISGGGGTGTPQAIDCPSGTIARWFQTRSGCAQDALELFCGEPSVSCAGGSSICRTQCGDGVVGAPDEACDDGNATSGDGCDATCSPEAGWSCTMSGAPCTSICGDGIVVGSEECDTMTASATCDADCTFAVCGDGVVNMAASETCDDGMETASCDADCTAPACGDGVLNTSAGETCDDGGESAACDTDCTPASCGDGVVNAAAGEACDDSGESLTCNADCSAASCGDGIVNTTAGETCDDGMETASCDADCTAPACGDGVTNAAAGETCDDAGESSTCDADCSAASCGDGTVNVAAMEVCDRGTDNSDTMADTCRTTCVYPSCGDGVVDGGETCDEGAMNSDEPGSACSTSCGPLTCGNGIVEGIEECDEGAANSNSDPDACRLSCALPRCGDGVLDATETCDEGYANSDAPGATCSSTCALPSCGDGVTDTGEQCDDGASNSDTDVDACRTSCVAALCGDGVVDTGEVCDEGRGNSDTAPNSCRRTCVTATCGDGVVDAGEGCDEGAANSDDPDATCRTTCALASCGDGVLDMGEECDDGAGNADIADACRTTCVNPSCGDGVVDMAEGCDDGAMNSDTRADACRTDCSVAICGDGVVDMGETCDDGADNSDTDADACRTDCSAARCGDGVVDGAEECDDGAGGSATCTSACTLAPTSSDGGVADGGTAPTGFGVSGGALCSAQPGSRHDGWALLLFAAALLMRRRRR